MNIVVCVKYVPDATADRKFDDDNTVDRVGVDGSTSELDEYAVEQSRRWSPSASACRGSRWPRWWSRRAARSASCVTARARPRSSVRRCQGFCVAPKAEALQRLVQQLAGMQASKRIVAVNKGPEAPIFELVDFGVVVDLHSVLPAATETITERKG